MAGGDAPTADDIAGLPPFEVVVAADSGLEHARATNLPVDAVVGDLDSVDPAVLEAARGQGVEVHEYPSDKDQSDLELALDEAVRRGATWIIVLGAGGGRLDHLIGNLTLLASPRFADVELEARWEGNRASVVRTKAKTLRGQPGDLVTLLPVNGPARVRTEGLRWPLVDEVLEPGSSRGVSNELTKDWAWVVAGEGVVLALQPA